MISIYGPAPCGRFRGGIFGGLLQKNGAIVVAASAQIRNIFVFVWLDQVKPWSHSPSGAAIFVGQNSLLVIAPILGAVVSRHALTSRARHHSDDQGAAVSPA